MELISSPIGFSLTLPALSLFWRKGQQRETIILASLIPRPSSHAVDPFDSARGTRLYIGFMLRKIGLNTITAIKRQILPKIYLKYAKLTILVCD